MVGGKGITFADYLTTYRVPWPRSRPPAESAERTGKEGEGTDIRIRGFARCQVLLRIINARPTTGSYMVSILQIMAYASAKIQNLKLRITKLRTTITGG